MSRTDGRARALLLGLFLLGGLGVLVPLLLTPPAFLVLTLADEVFGTPLDGLSGAVTDITTGVTLTLPVSAHEGRFGLPLGRVDSGRLELAVELPGFERASTSVELAPLAVVEQSVTLLPTFGRLELELRNARDVRQAVPARVTVDSREAGTGSEVLIGPLAPGVHGVEARADRYCPARAQATIVARETTRQVVPLSPRFQPPEVARVLLSWEDEPRDLDAHLAATNEAIPGPQVFFSHPRGLVPGVGLYGELDVDYQNSEGFETVTFYDRKDGDYEYFVHHYAGRGTLGRSGGVVEILTGDCESRRFEVPSGCAEQWWHVATLRLDRGQVLINPRNECKAAGPKGFRLREKADGEE